MRNYPRLKFPAKTEHLEFQNFESIAKSLFVLYADLETFFAPLRHEEETIGNQMTKLSRHHASAYGLYCVCDSEKFSDKEPDIYVGEDAIENSFRHWKRK